MRWGGGWNARNNRRSWREGADAQSSAHFGQSRSHACQADTLAFLHGKRLARKADAVVRNDEMRSDTAEAKQHANSGCMGMTMDVGQGFLGQSINRHVSGLRHCFRITSDIERRFESRSASKSLN